MMRHTFPVNLLLHSIFSTSKIISKVNEFIQRSRSTVKMQENVLHGPDTSCIWYNLVRNQLFRMKYTFPVKLYPHTLSVVQSTELRVKVQVKYLICRSKFSKYVLYWHFLELIQVLHSTVVIESKTKSWSIVTNLMHQSLWFWKPIGILTALWGPT